MPIDLLLKMDLSHFVLSFFLGGICVSNCDVVTADQFNSSKFEEYRHQTKSDDHSSDGHVGDQSILRAIHRRLQRKVDDIYGIPLSQSCIDPTSILHIVD